MRKATPLNPNPKTLRDLHQNAWQCSASDAVVRCRRQSEDSVLRDEGLGRRFRLPQCTLCFLPGVEPSGMQQSRRGLISARGIPITRSVRRNGLLSPQRCWSSACRIRRCSSSSSSTRHPPPHATDHLHPPHARLTVVDMLFHNQKSTHAVETLFGYAGFRV